MLTHSNFDHGVEKNRGWVMYFITSVFFHVLKICGYFGKYCDSQDKFGNFIFLFNNNWKPLVGSIYLNNALKNY